MVSNYLRALCAWVPYSRKMKSPEILRMAISRCWLMLLRWYWLGINIYQTGLCRPTCQLSLLSTERWWSCVKGLCCHADANTWLCCFAVHCLILTSRFSKIG